LHFRGLASIVRGRIDTAEQCFRRASSRDEYTPALSALAALHALRARPAEALDAAQRALASDPHDLQALLAAHDASWLAGQTAEAEEFLARALAVQTDCVPALLREFDVARILEAPRRASRALQKLRKAAPDLPEVKRRLAVSSASRATPPPPRAPRREKEAHARGGEGNHRDALTP
jgi:tetratricopeptide (TPR) repeat protein